MTQQTLFENIFREFFCFRARYYIKVDEKIFTLIERESGTGVSQTGTVGVLHKTTAYGTCLGYGSSKD